MSSTEDEDAAKYRAFATDQIFRTARTLIRCATVAVIFYWGFQALEVLAGQDTKLSIALSLVFTALVDIKFAAAISLAGGATAWAVLERRLRLQKVDNMQGRIKQLEQMIDPNRSSSGLTTEGRTNPKDRIR
jgi:Flp pilus assembly protein protease CpaA